jgi:hypothetical protein
VRPRESTPVAWTLSSGLLEAQTCTQAGGIASFCRRLSVSSSATGVPRSSIQAKSGRLWPALRASRVCQDPPAALWHTIASLLKDLGVPPRDAQIILGHAQITTTQQIYNHVDEAARLDAITKISRLRGPNEPALWPGMVDSGPLCAAGQNVLPGGGEGARTPDPCLQIAVIGRLTGR